MAIEQCWLTNQTGAIIRFRPSQLDRLPTRDKDLDIQLFDGRVVSGKFHRHPANPYVAGVEVRRFILDRVPATSREEALIDVDGRYWRLYEPEPVKHEVGRHGVSSIRAARGRLSASDLERILAHIDTITSYAGRRRAYDRLLRPPGLRRMMLAIFGSECQIEDCVASQTTARAWGDPMAGVAIVEVHHIDAVVRREDHHPRNLCILCGNHHRLIHGFGPWAIRHEGDDVILSIRRREMRIVRDLSVLQ